MAGTYGMRAVPLGPSYDLVVAGKSGMDGLWSAAHIFMSLAGKGLRNRRIKKYAWHFAPEMLRNGACR